MSQRTEWFKRQCEYNKRVYDLLHANHPGLDDWKVTVLFYSGLHRVNYWFDVQTGSAPENHTVRNQRVRVEMPSISNTYNTLYMMSRRARYCDGFRTNDAHRKLAAGLLGRLEEDIPFP